MDQMKEFEASLKKMIGGGIFNMKIGARVYITFNYNDFSMI